MLSGFDGLAVSFQPGGAVAAADSPVDPTDTDADGLSDDFEWVLRSSPVLADTDGDGYSDLEEFARGSAVFWAASVPLPGEFSTRMTARQGNGYVHVLMATYALDGNFTDFAQSLGLLDANDDLVLFPPGYVAAHGSTSTVTAADGSAVRLFELPIRDNLVHGAGGMTIFGTVARASTGTVIAADVVDLQSDAAHIFLRTQIKHRPSQRADLVTSTGSQGGSVYVPLPLPGQIPSTWSVGQICKQVTTVVGVADGVVTREVVSSGCVEAFDSYCKSDCTMAVGTVEKSVDPLSLIGG